MRDELSDSLYDDDFGLDAINKLIRCATRSN